ncbi:MAG: alpha amylase C-terminal domain-containing protein [Armatimonadetes bacterium]|nr:alpha amylase C-terminal domain-containing protein [Armatimonadota bacterium]
MVALDPWLEPYAERIHARQQHTNHVRSLFEPTGGLLGQVSQGHHYFGFTKTPEGVMYREWAPGAESLRLFGEFNDWNRDSHHLQRDEFGVWSILIPHGQLQHGQRVKVHVVNGFGMDRIPAYAQRVVQEPESHGFVAEYWDPPEPYHFQNESPILEGGLKIYESHVGIATEEGRIGTYDEFRRNVLPRIKDLGYNTIQLMAIQQHPYYASFGYHVSSFFAPSSWFGTPEELKHLIDDAHGMGLLVLIDLVHSHSVKNTAEGINRFDGTDHQYFHSGGRGEHPAWDSALFDYSKYEVLRYLLSNVRYWLEDFRFDGARFDGVTSMLYHDHGLGRAFSSYDDYFGGNVDWDAVTYLQLANELAHKLKPQTFTIAEDVSGMPGIARPVNECGIGFDYRLSMGAPDLWIKLLKEVPDENWNLGHIFDTMLNRRRTEKHIGYAESHDQALVGDKTIAFWLMDAEMYFGMDNTSQNLAIERGVALHKMIRLLTFSLAGEGYLNFMGNEFGHPEWLDFPREGNGYSFHYARRQWSLVDNGFLRYGKLRDFDRAMLGLDAPFGLLGDPLIEQLAVHEDTRQLVYRRGALVFAFNFHPTESFASLRIPVPDRTDYKVVLDTDQLRFGGHGQVEPGASYPLQDVPMYGRDQSIQVYLPARSAQVLAPV